MTPRESLSLDLVLFTSLRDLFHNLNTLCSLFTTYKHFKIKFKLDLQKIIQALCDVFLFRVTRHTHTHPQRVCEKAIIVNHSFHFVASSSSGTVRFSAPWKQNSGCFSAAGEKKRGAAIPRHLIAPSVVWTVNFPLATFSFMHFTQICGRLVQIRGRFYSEP